MHPTSIADVLREQAARQPEALAFHAPERTWRFAQIDAETSRLARGLISLGIGPGERVAILTRHTVACTLMALGAAKTGAVCMPVNWRLAAPEIAYILADGEARLVVTDAEFLPAVRATRHGASVPLLITDRPAGVDGIEGFDTWRARFPQTDPGYRGTFDDTAVQLYSSGTTGLPKGVEISNGNLLAAFREVGDGIAFDGQACVMFNALPAFHIAGLGLALISIARGGQTVCLPEFDPARVIAGVGEHRITHMFLVPAMILALIRTPGVERGDYRTLRSISYGASPISESVLVEALRVFGCGFVQLYGLTETCGAVTYLAPEDHDPGGARGHLLRAAGRAGPGVALRIVDAASGRDCAPGEVGEVWIRTRQNMKGYWRNPQATAQAYPEGRPDGVGWFRSGDAGYLRDGYLYIHDRIKDMIISGGENIYPAEVENALMQHPAIADGAVIGVPDERWGEAVKACVVLKPGTSTSAADIIDFVRERIAHYKCPKSVDFVKALPRNPSGKLLKYQLRQPYWQGQDRAVH